MDTRLPAMLAGSGSAFFNGVAGPTSAPYLSAAAADLDRDDEVELEELEERLLLRLLEEYLDEEECTSGRGAGGRSSLPNSGKPMAIFKSQPTTRIEDPGPFLLAAECADHMKKKPVTVQRQYAACQMPIHTAMTSSLELRRSPSSPPACSIKCQGH